MSRRKKEYRPFSIRMATNIYDRMDKYCENTGVPKTAVIERAINMYLDNYEETQKQLEQLKQNR